jgi:hypothetical protein
MYRLLLVANAALVSLGAQSLVDAGRLEKARAAFDAAGAAPALKCQFTSEAAALNYGLRFETSYLLELPMNQFHGAGHGWDVLLRVTPQGREPVFLTASEALPEVPATSVTGEFAGKFVVGEGSYSVDAILKDDAGRVCKSAWRIDAKLAGIERGLRPAMAAGTVAGVAEPVAEWARGDAKWDRVTVMLNASSIVPRHSQLQADDIALLSGSLRSLLEQIPVGAARVVIFCLEQRAVLYRKDNFQAADFEAATKALSDLQLGVVSAQTLESPAGTVEAVAGLIRDEASASPAPDAVIVASPAAPLRPKESSAPPEAVSLGPVKLFYLDFAYSPVRRWALPVGDDGSAAGMERRSRPNPMLMPPFPPLHPADAIGIVAKAMKGETTMIHSPHELAAAIGRMLGIAGGR